MYLTHRRSSSPDMANPELSGFALRFLRRNSSPDSVIPGFAAMSPAQRYLERNSPDQGGNLAELITKPGHTYTHTHTPHIQVSPRTTHIRTQCLALRFHLCYNCPPTPSLCRAPEPPRRASRVIRPLEVSTAHYSYLCATLPSTY